MINIIKNKKFLVMCAIILIIIVSILFASRNQNKQLTNKEPERGGPGLSCLDSLPITETEYGPFTLEYIGEDKFNNDIVSIKNSSPIGRQNAIHYLDAIGCDVSKIKLIFNDYKNPFKAGVDVSE